MCVCVCVCECVYERIHECGCVHLCSTCMCGCAWVCKSKRDIVSVNVCARVDVKPRNTRNTQAVEISDGTTAELSGFTQPTLLEILCAGTGDSAASAHMAHWAPQGGFHAQEAKKCPWPPSRRGLSAPATRPHQAPVQGLGLLGFSPEQGRLAPRPHVPGTQGRGVGLTSGGPGGHLRKHPPEKSAPPTAGSWGPWCRRLDKRVDVP